MFICTECKAKYEQKPEYCDCGNNIFEEIVDIKEEPVLPKEFKKESAIQSDKSKPSFLEQYPEIKRFTNSLDVLSTSIFVVCIILSILAWVFIGRENPNVSQHIKIVGQTQQTIKKKQQQLPNVDSFWNNPKPIVQKPVKAEKIENVQEENIQTPNPSEITKPMPQKVKMISPSSIQNPTPKSNIVKPNKQKNSLNNAAMTQYKAALRQTLFSHLAVTSITGAGRCRVEFSVSPSGKLLNRKFAKLSDNKSLNDAVYNMLMSVPQYYPPPVGYNGEKIGLSFYFNNGYYEVSY